MRVCVWSFLFKNLRFPRFSPALVIKSFYRPSPMDDDHDSVSTQEENIHHGITLTVLATNILLPIFFSVPPVCLLVVAFHNDAECIAAHMHLISVLGSYVIGQLLLGIMGTAHLVSTCFGGIPPFISR